jgi:acetoin utilization protein AcuB
MLVGERMSRHPITVRHDDGIDEALKVMRDNKVRRLPVINHQDELVGIVSEKDLLLASPSPATSLSIYEVHYLLSQMKVSEVMTEEVITVTEYTPLEEAACIMVDNKIGGLPVMRDGKMVGIITETDLFKMFIELLGARKPGVRITMLVPEQPGELAYITNEITGMGGNIVALGTFLGEDPTNRLVTIKVADVDEEKLAATMEAIGMELVDVRSNKVC